MLHTLHFSVCPDSMISSYNLSLPGAALPLQCQGQLSSPLTAVSFLSNSLLHNTPVSPFLVPLSMLTIFPCSLSPSCPHFLNQLIFMILYCHCFVTFILLPLLYFCLLSEFHLWLNPLLPTPAPSKLNVAVEKQTTIAD